MTDTVDISRLLVNGRVGLSFRKFDKQVKQWIKTHYKHRQGRISSNPSRVASGEHRFCSVIGTNASPVLAVGLNGQIRKGTPRPAYRL